MTDLQDTPGDETPPPVDKSFSQDDVDRIVRERIARVKHEPPADYADLQAAAARLAEIEEANKSELDKAIARAEAAENTAKEATERARESARNSEIVRAASAVGAIDADAVVRLLDIDAVTIGDDGRVTGAEEAVKALLESRPWLVGKPPQPLGVVEGGPRGSGDGPKQISLDDLSSMTPDAINAARLAGQLDDVMAGR